MPQIMMVMCMIFFSIIFIVIDFYCIMLMCGKGGFLLAGFNISAKATTAVKEYKYVLRRIGLCYLITFLLLHAGVILLLCRVRIWAAVISGLAVLALAISIYIQYCKKMRAKYKIIRKAFIKPDNGGDK